MENVRSPHMEEWKGGEKNPCGKKQRLILRWNFLSSFQCIGKNMCGRTDYRRLPIQTLFWSVPVMLARDSSSWAASGPRAMVWMTAPLCLTSSKQELIWSSSPSVSNTISEPEVVWLLEVIAWTGKATLLITGKWFLNKWKARKSCGLVLGESLGFRFRVSGREPLCYRSKLQSWFTQSSRGARSWHRERERVPLSSHRWLFWSG